MAVIQIKKWKYLKDENNKYIKDQNGNKIIVQKTNEELNKETCNGTKMWYFYTRYEINDVKKPYKSKKYALKREAEKDEREFLLDPILYLNKKNKIKTNENTKRNLDSYYEDFFIYECKYNKESTAYSHKVNYSKHISPEIGLKYPEDLNFDLIKSFHEKLDQKKCSIITKNNIHNAFSVFNGFLKLMGLTKENYAKNYGGFKKPKTDLSKELKVKFQTLEEFQLFISVVDDYFWKAFFEFAFWNGFRKGEQQALKRKDINFITEELDVYKTIGKSKSGGSIITTTKNERRAKTYLAHQCKGSLKYLYDIQEQIKGCNEEWFIFGDDKWIARNTIDRNFKKYYKKLEEKYPEKEIKILTHHEFGRHSHATYLFNIGRDNPNIVRIVAERLRDTEEIVKKTYIHVDDKKSNTDIKNILLLKN